MIKTVDKRKIGHGFELIKVIYKKQTCRGYQTEGKKF